MQSEGNENWKVKLLVVGTVIGAAIGLGTAYLMARTSEENVGEIGRASCRERV